uniref:Uncharacterized protein n=1 Tax=Anopheles maculatus TaxID=74869 RepID=A0A182SHE3_9DIPT
MISVPPPADATDATNSCDSDKAATAAVAVANTSSSPRSDERISPGTTGTSDSLASVEPGSSGGTSTPIAGASPASVTAGEVSVANPLCGGSSLTHVVPAVTNGGGGGGASNSSVPVSAGTTISIRGRGDVTDKNSLEYHCRMLEVTRGP